MPTDAELKAELEKAADAEELKEKKARAHRQRVLSNVKKKNRTHTKPGGKHHIEAFEREVFISQGLKCGQAARLLVKEFETFNARDDLGGACLPPAVVLFFLYLFLKNGSLRQIFDPRFDPKVL